MRVHFSSIVIFSIALLFVSGTTGCRSNGGPWYNPSTYTLANPFDKKEKPSSAPIYGETSPNGKPSLGGIPDVGSPMGGYTDASSLASSRTDPTSGTVNNNPPEHWGQPNPIASQSSPGPYGGYSVAAAPSQYSPYSEPYAGQSAPASPYQYPGQAQASAQYTVGGAPYQNTMPYGDTTPPGYQMTSAASNNVYSSQTGGTADYVPGGMPQYDPSYVAQQQPATAPPAGYSYGAPPAGYSYGDTATVGPNPYQQGYPQQPQGYGYPPSDGATVAQPYQQPASGGYNYSY